MKKLLAILLAVCLLSSVAFTTVSAEEAPEAVIFGFTALNSADDIAGALTPDDASETLKVFIEYFATDMYEFIQETVSEEVNPGYEEGYDAYLAKMISSIKVQIARNKIGIEAMQALTDEDIEMFVAHNADRGLNQMVVTMLLSLVPDLIDRNTEYEQLVVLIQQEGFGSDLLSLFRINDYLADCGEGLTDEYKDAAFLRYLEEYSYDEEEELEEDTAVAMYDAATADEDEQDEDEGEFIDEEIDDETAMMVMLDNFVIGISDSDYVLYLYLDEENVTSTQYDALVNIANELDTISAETKEYLSVVTATFGDFEASVEKTIAAYEAANPEPTEQQTTAATTAAETTTVVVMLGPVPTETAPTENPKTGSAAAPFGALLLAVAAAAVIAKSKRR